MRLACLGAHGLRRKRGPALSRESELRVKAIAEPFRVDEALCCGAKYVAVIQITAFQQRLSLSLRNIIISAHNDFRKAIKPFFSFHGRLGFFSAMSQSSNALAFISRSISA